MCCFNIFIVDPNDKDRITQIIKENIDLYLVKYLKEDLRVVLVKIVKKYVDGVIAAINPVSAMNAYDFQFPVSYYDPKLCREETCLGLDNEVRDKIERHGTGIIELGGMIFHCGFLGTDRHLHPDDHAPDFFNNFITPQTRHLVVENVKTRLSSIFNVDECQCIANNCLKYIGTVIDNIKPSFSSCQGYVDMNEFNFPITYFKNINYQQYHLTYSNSGTGLIPIGEYFVHCCLLSCDCYPKKITNN